ncbi:MAG: helix-turn-helix domain-containing protein [Armatimonadota bacterium]
MAVCDRKLGEWFKELEQIAQQVRAKKQSAKASGQDAGIREVKKSEQPSTQAQPVVGETRAEVAGRQDLSVAAGEPVGVNGGAVAVVQVPQTSERVVPGSGEVAKLFDDEDIPQVEDFISFLDREEPQKAETPRVEVSTVPSAEQTLPGLSEGTGTPRPIFEVPAVEKKRALEREPSRAEVKPNGAKTPHQPAPASQFQDVSVEEKWGRIPAHIRAIFESETEEVAQRSYKTFKESRASLIERLLDPTITLEDTARLLNVCPTTVRRYTNKGILKHFRTPGNQRRFKLSDVIAFLESRKAGRVSGGGKSKPEEAQ